MNLKKIGLAAAVAAALAGCGQDSDKPAPNLNLNDPATAAKMKQAAKAAAQEKQSAAAPHGDSSIPLDKYQELHSGKQLLYAYYAASAMPVDFEKVAAIISPQYRNEQDEFKKHDMLAALKPGILGEIDKAKQSQYYFMQIGNNRAVNKYDFSNQTFGVEELSDASTSRYFGDAYSYQLKFSNSKNFSSLKVADENTARTIESLRLQNGLRLVVYFFASDTELGDTKLKAEIMHIRLIDKQGKVLAEQ